MYYKYWINDTVLPDSLCDTIIQQVEQEQQFGPLRYGTLYGQRQDPDLRTSGVLLFPATTWIGGMLSHYVNIANRTTFEFDLDDMWAGNNIQYTMYKGGEHYTWHSDEHLTNREDGQSVPHLRKLSFSLQLSDENDYEGGEMQLAYPKLSTCVEDPQFHIVTVPRKRGTIIVFPSYTLHCVKPVTKGTRRSLVGWMMGVPFK